MAHSGGGKRTRGRPRPRPGPGPPPVPAGPIQTVLQGPLGPGGPLVNPNAAATAPDGATDADALGGGNIGPEQFATPAGAPSPSPIATPIAGTFSRPGQGKARALRGVRIGGRNFGGRKKLDRVLTAGAGAGTTSPRPQEEDSPLRRALSNVFRG